MLFSVFPVSLGWIFRSGQFAAAAALLLAAALSIQTGCRQREGTEKLLAGIDHSLALAARFLMSKQSADGAWRSEVYGGLKDGPSLTPPILKFLFYLPDPSKDTRDSFRRGDDYLMSWIEADGKVKDRGLLAFPVYTAAMASVVVDLENQDEAHRRAQAVWLNHLLNYRLGKSLGWNPEDTPFGGWGYAVFIPEKPRNGMSPYESNLSATLFGIAALRHAGVPAGDPIYTEILTFVMKCQNFSDDRGGGDALFDDGGFFFTPSDPPRNKAGIAGTDRSGKERYHSYGSATADGLRALLRCGLPPDHPRVQAARRWLEQNFSATSNPGKFTEDREVLRNATYYYYCWSVAHTIAALTASDARSMEFLSKWSRELARTLLSQQGADGAWRNRFTDGKEDDPLVATPLAAAALVHCRGFLSGLK
jgi:hypothetical protein